MNIPSSEEIEKHMARKSHLKFMEHCWTKKSSPMIVGLHTKMICDAIDEAMEKMRQGESSYLMIKVPFRHGKSDILSRFLPPHFLAEFPEYEVIQTSYNTTLAQKFSKDAKNILNSPSFKELYPDINIHPDIANNAEWALDNGLGKTLWVGMDGGMTGAGAHLALVDDPFKNREEAESEVIRTKRWEAFTDALITRLAPVHILIVLATPWHEQDLFGKIGEEMERNPRFPRFKELCFPAKAADYFGEGSYTGQYLFGERFQDSWYESMYAALGSYSASGLLDCNPKPRDGQLLACEEGRNWTFVPEKPEKFGRSARAWDLASSSPKTSSDPDWTVGVKGAIRVEHTDLVDPSTNRVERMKMIHIYIEDIIRIREEATKRNQQMLWAAHKDGAGTFHLVENFGAQKDTISILRSILGGSRVVKGVKLKGDKLSKAAENLEVPFAAGNVYIDERLRGTKVLDEFLSSLEGFPSAAHDDDVDALAILVAELSSGAYDAWWVDK